MLDTFVTNFHGFDVFMILFTVILVWSFVREIRRAPKNLFALGFVSITLATFLFLDALMVANWFGVMPQIHLFPSP